ncbi:MAG: VWA domain-containing protein [Anaerolineae bacterium]|jgi:Mg-chelatase subunit ChlD|nr:VWA domain-containing protein [Anaerolineae bacterium]
MVVKNATSKAFLTFLLLAYTGYFFPSTETHAQAYGSQLVSHVDIDAQDHLQVDVYFSITDASRYPIGDADLESVELTVENLSPQPGNAVPIVPDSPIYVLFVADISGSMSTAYQQMLGVVSQIAQGAPENGQYALSSFASTWQMNVDFTPDASLVVQAMTTLSPQNNTDTCFFNALNSAVSTVQRVGTAGRRAVVVLSDGIDRLLRSSSAPCSSLGVSDVVRTARGVPVHVVGIAGGEGINEQALRAISEQTNGSYIPDVSSDVGTQMQAVMERLSYQWYAQFKVYPPANGTYNAEMTPIFSNQARGEPISLLISSTRAYSPPFQVCSGLQAVVYNAETDTISYRLCADGLDRVGTLSYSLIDLDSNTALVVNMAIPTPSDPIVINARQVGLIPGGDYLISLSGTDRSGRPLFEPGDESANIEFTYRPPTVALQPVEIQVPNFVQQGDQYLLNMVIPTGRERIARVEMRLVAEDGQTSTVATLSPEQLDQPFALSMEGLQADTGYELVIIALDAQSLTLAQHVQAFTTPNIRRPSLVINAMRQEGIDDQQVYRVTLTTADMPPEAVLQYQLRNPERENESLPPVTVDLPVSEIVIPISALVGGNYQLVLQAFDGDTLIFASEEGVGLNIVFSPWYQFANFFRSPIGIILLVALIAGSIFGYRQLKTRPNPKSKPGAPLPSSHIKADTSRIKPVRRAGSGQPFRKPTGDPAEVVVVKSNTFPARHTYIIKGDKCTVGRLGGNDLRFGDVDNSVSGRHLTIQLDRRAKIATFSDNNSSYGTIVNGQKIDSKVSIPFSRGKVEVLLPDHEGVQLSVKLPRP